MVRLEAGEGQGEGEVEEGKERALFCLPQDEGRQMVWVAESGLSQSEGLSCCLR